LFICSLQIYKKLRIPVTGTLRIYKKEKAAGPEVGGNLKIQGDKETGQKFLFGRSLDYRMFWI
ncbi:MAG: hypothetical protein MJY77_09120, partial [Bacteroidaceae bacterium]|nr:hypothetical protein [Bacteroidaceae bacterium]